MKESQQSVHRVFVIGGVQIYKNAMESSLVNRIMLTRVHGDNFECDAYFPVNFTTNGQWEQRPFKDLISYIDIPNVPPREHEQEGGIDYSFEMWERV